MALLETLLALAVLVLVLGMGYSIASRISFQQARGQGDLALAELAYAVLTEYSVSYPQMPTEGTLGERYAWTITMTPYAMSSERTAALPLTWRDLAVEVWDMRAPQERREAHSILVLRSAP